MYFKHRLANVFYEKKGNSPSTILILPGWGNTRSTFQFIVDYFQSDFTIYIFDYPGFGNSPPIHKTLTMEDYALIIKDFMSDKKIRNPIIFAHSFGGRILSIISGQYQIPIQKIVLIDVAGIKRIKPLLLLRTLLYKIIKKFCVIFHKPTLLAKVRNHFSSSDYQMIPPFMTKTFQNIIREDLRKNYQKIKSEVLILWGEYDYDTPLKDAHFLHHHIPNSGLIIYPKTGHFSYLEKKELTLKILDAFLKEKDKD